MTYHVTISTGRNSKSWSSWRQQVLPCVSMIGRKMSARTWFLLQNASNTEFEEFGAVECWGTTVVELRFRIDLSLPLFRLIRILETNCHSVCASRNYAYAVLGPIIIHTTTHRHCQGKLDWKRFVFLWAFPFKIVILWKMGRIEL